MMTDQKGFSLLEVVVGLGLILFVSAGMAASTIGSIQTGAVSNQVTVASFLVQDKIEQLRSLDPSTNPADLTVGSHSDAAGAMDQFGQSGGAYTRTWTVTEDTPILGMSEVVITVSWNGPTHQTMSGVTFLCDGASCT